MPRIRTRLVRRKARQAGLPPGTLQPAEQRVEKVRISFMDYDATNLAERDLVSVAECVEAKDRPSVTWIDVVGLHEVDVIERLGAHFGLHPLVLEDILSTSQRPKMEKYEGYLFLTLRMITYDDSLAQLHDEQISMVLGSNYLLTFQEAPGDVFDVIRQRIRSSSGRIRGAGADYLAYALMDALVDHYFIVLEKIGDHVEGLEEELVDSPTRETLTEIYRLKRETLYLRRSVWPVREMVGSLQREESELIQPDTRVFVRDLYDHTIQVIDTTETVRDLISGMLDTYLSVVSNRMNEVMKVLTIMATIFIPLTFIAGVYGMNFQRMPELAWPWGYPVVLGAMAVTAGSMVLYFRRKGWL